MSIEYTIDIQLTELGFPDILQPQEALVRQTPCRSASSDDSISPSHSPASLSTKHKPRRLLRGGKVVSAARHTSDTQETTMSSGPSKQTDMLNCNPTNTLQDKRGVSEIALAELSVPRAMSDPSALQETTDIPLMITEQEGGGGQRPDEGIAQGESVEVQEDDSDDSEVSEVYEEEEFDEEEDEEGLSSESSQSGDYRCSVCDQHLPSKFKLQDHMNLHTGARPYCCAECGKRFCQIYNYRVHLRTHAQTKVDRLQCRVCLMGFASQEDLNDHLSKTHLEDEFYECDLCKRVFTSLKACEYHVQLHKCMLNVVCEVCGRNFSSSKSLARHRRKKCHRSFKCTDCTKVFTKKNALLKHSFSHLGLLPYTCIRCRCHFRLAKLYRQHKCEPERIHCVACLREFLSQEDFQQHKKDTGCWGNQEPSQKTDEIRCLECGEKFDSPEELKKHAGAHQRVLKCAECGKGFRSALLLMSHMGGHAGQSPCLCQSCGLGFPHQQNYDSHLKMCGQIPQSANAAKKRQSLKSSVPEAKKLRATPDSSNTAKAVSMPPVVLNNPVAPVEDRSSPGHVTKGGSAGSGPSDGLWKLTLDKQPPSGMNLVLFVPVCPTQANGLPLPSAIPQTVPMQALPEGPLAVSAALGATLNARLDLLTGIKQDPEAPLDLSKKSAVTYLPVKSEPEESEISGQAVGDCELWSSGSNQLTDCKPEKVIKIEADISSTAFANKEK